MPGLENQEWWVYPQGNSPHPSSCYQEVEMSYGWATYNLDRYTKVFMYTSIPTSMILMLSIIILPEIEEAILLYLGLNLG